MMTFNSNMMSAATNAAMEPTAATTVRRRRLHRRRRPASLRGAVLVMLLSCAAEEEYRAPRELYHQYRLSRPQLNINKVVRPSLRPSNVTFSTCALRLSIACFLVFLGQAPSIGPAQKIQMTPEFRRTSKLVRAEEFFRTGRSAFPHNNTGGTKKQHNPTLTQLVVPRLGSYMW